MLPLINTSFFMKISVVGTGYVGLVSGTCLAELGHTVMCIDIDEKKIENLKNGIIPIYEPGLKELVLRNQKEGRLLFSTDIKEGITFGDAIFSAVGTPPNENHEADLKYVMQVARDFATHVDGYKVFITKSTVPVGTNEAVKEVINGVLTERGADVEFDIVSNPEFLREGTAVKDFMGPDRMVVGIDPKSKDEDRVRAAMTKIYDPLVRVGRSLMFTDIRSSEIIKYASNAFLATKISFINEISNFCDINGGDVKQIAIGMGLDKRIGPRFLHAGVGYGGSCFPKDVQALIQTGKAGGYDFQILNAAESVNQHQRERIIEKLNAAVNEVRGKTIAVWGLAFKPRTDDMREAPSTYVVPELQKAGAIIRAFDPVAQENAPEHFSSENITYHENAYEAAEGADLILILTEWDEFRILDFERLKETMVGRLIIDGRNIYERPEVEQAGFEYHCFGR
jgi:UDPglucose 6-dehydrogenase